MTTATYSIKGMTCDHCVRAVTTEVSRVPGVTDVQVDLAAATATVTAEGPIVDADIAAAVSEAGYELAG
jgi:copper ion binding protein